jgi:hypothetical protein
MTQNLMSIIESAMEIADKIPEKYQVAAFEQLLRHALGSAPVSAEADTGAPVGVGPSPSSGGAGLQALAGHLPNDFVVKGRGSRAQQAMWAVLKLQEDGAEATPARVRDTVKTRLGKTPESAKHTSRTLRDLTPRYLERRESEGGRGYAYAPTQNALEIFDGLGDGAEE